MNIVKLVLILSVISSGIAFNQFTGFAVDTPIRSAEQIIQVFMDAKEMDIQPDTEEYTIFMRGICTERGMVCLSCLSTDL